MQRKGFPYFHSQYLLLFYLALGLLLFGITISLLYNQQEQFMTVNKYHIEETDTFFRFYTNLGDGVVMALLAVVFLFKRIKYGILTVSCFLLSGIVAQLIKRSVKMPRPGKVFSGNPDWYTLPDYHIHGNYSFPSGHTTTSFALMVVLYYIFPSQRKNPLFFILACLCGYSRIYLSQHWAGDVFVGALLGTLVSIGVIYWFENSKWYHRNWANMCISFLRKKTD